MRDYKDLQKLLKFFEEFYTNDGRLCHLVSGAVASDGINCDEAELVAARIMVTSNSRKS
jgi:hypothetical protein